MTVKTSAKIGVYLSFFAITPIRGKIQTNLSNKFLR